MYLHTYLLLSPPLPLYIYIIYTYKLYIYIPASAPAHGTRASTWRRPPPPAASPRVGPCCFLFVFSSCRVRYGVLGRVGLGFIAKWLHIHGRINVNPTHLISFTAGHAEPKSISTGFRGVSVSSSAEEESRTLCGLMSQCASPCACTCCSPVWVWGLCVCVVVGLVDWVF